MITLRDVIYAIQREDTTNKPLFVNVFKQSQIEYTTLTTIMLEQTNVAESVVSRILAGLPIDESSAP
jgi:hypothetical protein